MPLICYYWNTQDKEPDPRKLVEKFPSTLVASGFHFELTSKTQVFGTAHIFELNGMTCVFKV